MRLYISSLIAFDRNGEYSHAPLFFSAQDDRQAIAYVEKMLRQKFPPRSGYIRGLHQTEHIDEESVWSEANHALGQANEQDFDDDFFEDDYDPLPRSQSKKREPVTTWQGARGSKKPLPRSGRRS